jgi:hypothetical protein
VAEYLLAEVLEQQGEQARRRLLRTCLVERISGGLADALTGGSGGERILQNLEAANAFVVALDAARSWFRYHRRFGGLLQLERRRPAPGEVTGLPARFGRLEVAIDHRAVRASPIRAPSPREPCRCSTCMVMRPIGSLCVPANALLSAERACRPMSRRVDGALVLTADPINTAKGGRLIGDRTRRISLVMRMPGSRQSPTPVPRIWSRSDDGRGHGERRRR